MEQPVYAQAMQAGLALLLGVGLGIVYDALKAARLSAGGRRARRALTAAADILFCAVMAFALFSFGLGPGEGSLRAFMLCCAGCGWGLYALTLSPFALRFFSFVVKWLCKAGPTGAQVLVKTPKNQIFSKKYLPKNSHKVYNDENPPRAVPPRRNKPRRGWPR